MCDRSGFSGEGILISATMVLHCRDIVYVSELFCALCEYDFSPTSYHHRGFNDFDLASGHWDVRKVEMLVVFPQQNPSSDQV